MAGQFGGTAMSFSPSFQVNARIGNTAAAGVLLKWSTGLIVCASALVLALAPIKDAIITAQ